MNNVRLMTTIFIFLALVLRFLEVFYVDESIIILVNELESFFDVFFCKYFFVIYCSREELMEIDLAILVEVEVLENMQPLVS